MIDRELMEQMIEEEEHRYANAATRLEKTVDDLVCESKIAVLELRNAEDYIRNLNADKSPKANHVCANCGVEVNYRHPKWEAACGLSFLRPIHDGAVDPALPANTMEP